MEGDNIEFTSVDFYASIGRGEAICAGYSMALWKVLTELNIPCRIVLGVVAPYAPYEEGKMGHAWNQVCINETWYNVDLTWFSACRNIRELLQDDQNFLNRIPYPENKVEQCPIQYSRKKITYFLEMVRNYPNFFIEYDEKVNKGKQK